MRYLAWLLLFTAFGQQATFKSSTRLVVLNVFAKDKSGKDLTTLSKENFTVLEDGKPQNISIFELQRLDAEPAPATAVAAVKPTEVKAKQITTKASGQIQYRDRRLLVFFFDMSSMPPQDQIRASKAALKFVDTQMKPADMVAMMTFATKLEVKQDFTDNREELRAAIKALRVGEGSDLGEASTGSEDEADNGAAFQADESEFNIFNTDRKLSALEAAAKMLSNLPEKKALLYFSSGVSKTGMENQSQLESTMNAAVRDAGGFDVEPRGAYMRTFDIAGPAYVVGGRRVKLMQVSDKYSNVPTPKAVLDQLGYHLHNGHPCIVEVDFDSKSPTQQQHFALALPTGADGKPSPTINDPWDGIVKPLVPAFGHDLAGAMWRFIAYEVTL